MMDYPKPAIGVTSHLALQPDSSGREGAYLRVGRSYVQAVKDAGGLPVVLPALPETSAGAADILDLLDGLLLTGGSGLPAGAFTTRMEPTLRETNPDRYDYEVTLVREAQRRGLPLMGICRGHQTLVEALGGTLLLNVHIKDRAGMNHYQTSAPDETTHHIDLMTDQWPAQVLGTRRAVNSFHRQAVDRPPEGLHVAAVSEDGLIEAVAGEDPFVLGLQFHPERLYGRQPQFLKLFERFVQSAGAFSRRAK